MQHLLQIEALSQGGPSTAGSSPKTQDGHLLAAGGQAAPSGLGISLFPTHVQLAQNSDSTTGRGDAGVTPGPRKMELDPGNQTAFLKQIQTPRSTSTTCPEGKVIMGQVALLIQKTSQQHFQNRLHTDSKGQTHSHTTQKQHSLQMCMNKTRSLAPEPPNSTALWLS